MRLGRVFASMVIVLFTAFAIPTFLFFAILNTYFKPDFYTGPFLEGSYDIVLNLTSKTLYKSSNLISQNFTSTDIRREVGDVFNLPLYRLFLARLFESLEQIDGKRDSLEFSIAEFQNSVLTLVNNLAYRIFVSLPACRPDQVVLADSNNPVPSCLPPGIRFEVASDVFKQKAENDIYAAIPPKVSIDLRGLNQSNVTYQSMFAFLEQTKIGLFIFLIVFISLIALLVREPFHDILKYESIALFVAGGCTLIFSFVFANFLQFSNWKINGDYDISVELMRLLVFTVSFVSRELQNISLVVLGLAAVLLMGSLFFKNRSFS